MKFDFHCDRCRKTLNYVPLPRKINNQVIGVCRECSSEFEQEASAEDMFPMVRTGEWKIKIPHSDRPAIYISDKCYALDDPNAVLELANAYTAEELAYLVLALAKNVEPDH